jgi:hypothetical protein
VSAPDARHRTPPFRVADLTWVVRSDDAQLVEEIADLYHGCRASSTTEPVLSFMIVRSTDDPEFVDVYRDAVMVRARVQRALAVAHVVWAMNSEVVAAAGAHLLLHAAAVERSGAALVVSGAEGSGKSTLAAALVRAGLAYVTDEVVAVDATTGAIAPYAKPIVLERGSWPLFDELGPPPRSANGDADQWLVAPHRLAPGPVATEPSMPRVLIFPSYEPGAACEPEPVDRADAVIAVCTHSFNFRARSPGALEVVARLVRASACFRLRYRDAHIAAGVARELLIEASS